MGKKTDEDIGQQAEAVLSLLRREEPAAQIARRHGVCEATLYRWRDDFLEGGRAGLKRRGGKGDPSVQEAAQLRRALAERDRVIGELTIANRILKKTADGLY